MRAFVLIATIIIVAVAAIAATDPLADLTQEVTDLRAQVTEMESRIAYLELFFPADTFEPIEGAGSTAELAADVNTRIALSDGIEIAVTGASEIRRRTIQKELHKWARPSTGKTLIAVDVNIYNANQEHGVIKSSTCPWESHNTLAIDYDFLGTCEEIVFWNMLIGEHAYPLIGPISDRDIFYSVGYYLENNLDEDDVYWGITTFAEMRHTTMYFHIENDQLPSHALLAYKHPANPDSHRYWKLKRER